MRRWRGDDVSSDQLPPRPSLDQLRRRAKELRNAARSGDLAAVGRIAAHTPAARPGTVTLAAVAAAGSAATVRLLLDHGADIEARDTTWVSAPLEWAIVGSGMRPGPGPRPDWPATVRVLLDAGASTDGIILSPDDPKPPSPEVAALLRTRGIPDEADAATGD
jgi:hypothetical protein